MWRAFILAAILSSGQQPNAQRYTGPNCLGPFCVGRNLALRSVLKHIGQPATKTEPFCYQSQDGRRFLWLASMAHHSGRAGDALLSDFPNCRHRAIEVAAVDLSAWKTKEGIGLGSSEQDVLKAYGKPSRKDTIDAHIYRWVIRGAGSSSEKLPHRGDTVLVYRGDDLRVAEFGFRNGRVCWIFLAENE